MKIPAKLAILLVSLLWGSEWLFKLSGDTSLSGLPPFRVLSLRCFIAAIALIPWAIPRRTRDGNRSPSFLPLFPNILLGLVLIALPAIYLAGRSDLSPGLAVLLFATIPLVAAMLESSSGLNGAPALLGGLAGIAFLVRGSLSSSTSQALSLLGLTLIVVIVAALLVRAKTWLTAASVPASVMVQMLTAGIAFALYSLLFEHMPAVPWTGAQIAVVLSLGVLGSAVAYCLFYSALREVKASQVSAVQWLIPAVGIAETALLFRHLPEWGSLAGGLLAIGSAITLLYASTQGDAPLTLQITGSGQDENGQL
jgi:drug/metabolite transporter (DMT)-like permease